MPPRASEFEQDMQRLEAEIKRLEAEYNQFFAGRLPRLPWETRARVEAIVKRYDRMHLRNTAERFRFATVQSRFVSFCDLWERALKAKEEGRPQGVRRAAQLSPDPVPARHDRRAREGVVHEAAVRNPANDADRVKALYDRLSEARKQAGEKPLAYDRFAEVIKAQVNKLGRGESDVAFRVVVKDGKVTLSAKAVKE